MNAYKNIRIANEILNRAEQHQIEADCMVQHGDQWVNGECEDSVNEQFPEFSRVMTDLDMEYDREELMAAFALLIETGNQAAY